MKYVAKEYVPGTTRRRVVTDGGSLLESQTVYLPASAWTALKALSWKQGRSGSRIIESLILLAAMSGSDHS